MGSSMVTTCLRIERYEAHNDGHRPPLLEGVHPEPANLGHGVGEICLPVSFKLPYEIVGDDLLQDTFGILGTQRLAAFQGGEQAPYPHRRGTPALRCRSLPPNSTNRLAKSST